MFKDTKSSFLKIVVITLIMSCGTFLYSNNRELAVCVVGTGLSYSGMYLMFKDKEKREELPGALIFFMGLAMILYSDGIAKTFTSR